MPMDKFLIAPINSGLQTDLKPWQIIDDAFSDMQNAYIFRGRVKKRFGSVWMGTSQLNTRFRVQVGTIGGPTSPVPGSIFQIGQMFSAGTQLFTVIQVGNPAAMLATGPGTGTFSTTTGAFALAGTGLGGGTPIYWYPGEPVMGLTQYDSGNINDHPSYGFDTQFAYVFINGAWARSGTAIWHGTNANYYWAINWQGSTTDAATPPVMFVTNFNATVGTGPYPAATDDPIWTFDGATWTPHPGSSAAGFFFLPVPAAAQPRVQGQFIQTAKIIVAFKDRLLLLYTIENDNSNYAMIPGTGVTTSFPNRCRYSINGSPFALNAWYEQNSEDSAGNIGAGAGYIDATTEESIVSAEFIKDRLIVYFERSTWEIVYTGNEISPFIWQKLNTELGSQSTFSTIPFDKDVLTIGNTGVHACNGINVTRIDNKIPNHVFDFFETKNNATLRTYGIRDYYNEMVYWAYCENNLVATQTFPNQILSYNYKAGAWSVYDDTVTVFGYFEQGQDLTWAGSAPLTWINFPSTWSSSFVNANQRQILIGTPEGYVLILADDISRNAPSMQITNMAIAATGIITLTIIDHNLDASSPVLSLDNDFILIENAQGSATITTYFGTGLIFPVNSVIDANTITINTFGGLTTGTYTGGGTVARVSNVQLKTKQFNPYDKQDMNVFISKIDFAVQKTVSGEITVDYLPSSTTVSMIQGGQASGALMGTGVLETRPYSVVYAPLEQFQDKLWHPVYLQCYGECIQLFMYFSLDQMINTTVSLSDFQLEGFVLYTEAIGRMQ